MSIQTKRAIVTNTDGTTVLFSLPDVYNENSLWTQLELADGSCSFVFNTYFSGGYFQLALAPPIGSKIYCTYEVTVTDSSDPSNFNIDGVSMQNIIDIVNVLKKQSDTIAAMNKAIQNRITISDFTKFTNQVNEQLLQIQTSKVLGS